MGGIGEPGCRNSCFCCRLHWLLKALGVRSNLFMAGLLPPRFSFVGCSRLSAHRSLFRFVVGAEKNVWPQRNLNRTFTERADEHQFLFWVSLAPRQSCAPLDCTSAGPGLISMDIKQAQRLLLENNGWVQGPYNDVLLSTIANCTEQGIAAEQRQGWKLVAVFHGHDMRADHSPGGFPNRAVFERPLPTFHSAPDPWHDGPRWAWLPQLDLPAAESAISESLGVGGHGSPFLVRSFRCRCGRAAIRVFQDDQRERYVVVCAECSLVSNAFSFEPFDLPELRHLEHGPWAKLQCPCGGDQHTLHYGIEYSPDSQHGSDFTWISLAANCTKCGRFAQVCSLETK